MKYKVDEFLKKKGHEVLRLPPYHCDLNPIEFIWGILKNRVAINNTTFKLEAESQRVQQEFSNVTETE